MSRYEAVPIGLTLGWLYGCKDRGERKQIAMSRVRINQSEAGSYNVMTNERSLSLNLRLWNLEARNNHHRKNPSVVAETDHP